MAREGGGCESGGGGACSCGGIGGWTKLLKQRGSWCSCSGSAVLRPVVCASGRPSRRGQQLGQLGRMDFWAAAAQAPQRDPPTHPSSHAPSPCRFLSASDPRLQKLRQFAHSPVTWFRNPFVQLVLVSGPRRARWGPLGCGTMARSYLLQCLYISGEGAASGRLKRASGYSPPRVACLNYTSAARNMQA